jgi:hypothetical protein
MVLLPALTAALKRKPYEANASFSSFTSEVNSCLSDGLEPERDAGYSQLKS